MRTTRSRRRTTAAIAGVALSALTTLLPVSAAADLSPEVQADLHLVQTEEYIKEKNYEAAKEAMGKIIGLQEKHGLQLPHEFHFKYAQVLEWAGAHAEAIESLKQYLELAGRSGAKYREALVLLNDTMKKEEALRQQEAAHAAEEEAFERAKSTGTAAAYSAYLTAYPSGAHAAQARRLRDQARDNEAYERARTQGTAAAYQAYLTTYPSGRHALAARRLRGEARDDEAFERATQAGTTSGYSEYLNAHPSGRHAATARRLMGSLVVRFRDCDICPEMVVVPAGSFMMGSTMALGDYVRFFREYYRRADVQQAMEQQGISKVSDDNIRAWAEFYDEYEGPPRRVSIEQSFAVGAYEITRDEFGAFINDTDYPIGSCFKEIEHDDDYRRSVARYGPEDWQDPGFLQSDDHPVTCVNWYDAQEYVRWLSMRTGNIYRLLTETEWEYVARAGTSTPYNTGKTISNAQVHYGEGTVAVGTYQPNAFGLYDVHGNVAEWVDDCSSGAGPEAVRLAVESCGKAERW